jgi:hypothetical protein
MAIEINYQKRKNKELFKSMEETESISLSELQNYIPVYKSFFALNETNYNSINLNNKWSIMELTDGNNPHGKMGYWKNMHKCITKDITNTKTQESNVFFKMAPLLNPFKYLTGKYVDCGKDIFKLPHLTENEGAHASVLDNNNSAYVDGCFTFLSSHLIHQHGFVNGVDYYGSFLGVKNNFKVDVIEDLDHLVSSEYFIKNKDILFSIEDYSHIILDDATPEKLRPIKIHELNDCSANADADIAEQINEEIFEGIFEIRPESSKNQDKKEEPLSLDDLKDMSLELVDITLDRGEEESCGQDNKMSRALSSSSCSSRTSVTNSDDYISGQEDESFDEQDDCGSSRSSSFSSSSSRSGSSSSSEYIEETLNATINKFPVQVIAMEYCETTFDNLIENNDMKNEEWLSALMQVIMILLTYQKAFLFTHNDLHTNNIMCNATEKTHIYYLYKKVYYKVPTFGRIFKIIDFGRSIYKFKNHLFCSDSFQPGNDASTQYNTEPYLNENKPRVEPNYSFDLCRLACSIYDFIIEEDNIDEEYISKMKPFAKIIREWCLDDNGVNMLYKTNGAERYPGFKLYKMIARHVHKHTPKAQLDRPEFAKFAVSKSNVKRGEPIIDIDQIPCCATV